MKNTTIALCALLAVGILGTSAFAAKPAAKTAAKSAKVLSCPACHMPMSTKKTAAMPVAVKIKGTTYYCCAACPAGKAHLKAAKAAVKPAAAKTSAAKPTSAPKM